MLYPETKAGVAGGKASGTARRTSDTASVVQTKSFVDDTAEKMQVVPRTVERKIQVAKSLISEVKTIVKDHGISEKNSLKLARIKEPEKQKEAAEKLAQGHHKATTKLPQSYHNNGRTTGRQKYSKVTAKTRYIHVTYTLQS